MKTINFIDGLFTPEEAKEILTDVLSKTINFYNVKNFTSQIRLDQPHPESELRMKELRESREELLAIFQNAKDKNLRLKIDSTIKISFEAQDEEKFVPWQEIVDSYKA